MAPYRIALIGTGRVGYQFDFGDLPDNHAEAIQQVASCELVAGVNRGRDKLEDFGRRFDVDALYHDYMQMLEEVKPDICIITTHPELHCDMVLACAEAACVKAIICEKPMGLTLAECDRMIDSCERSGTLLQMNHNRRWNPEWALGLQLFKDGAIGDLKHILCYWDGGKPAPWWRSENEGPLLHDFTHYFDMMDMFAGEVEWVCGVAEQRMRPWAVEDFGTAFMKFRNGITGMMHSAELSNYTDTDFQLRGDNGVIHLAWEKVRLMEPVKDDYEADTGFQWSSLQEVAVDHPAPVSTYVLALEELVAALEGRGDLRSDGRVGRRSLELVIAIYQSQLAGNQPVHLPLKDRDTAVQALRDAGQFTDSAEAGERKEL
jgi:predicted dehydrogenase